MERRRFGLTKYHVPVIGQGTAENAGAGDLRLTDAEMDLIDEVFPRGPRPRQLPML
jgi:aryl-alcohol dehydrogenase-like predicted oxidoreductase